MFGYLLRKFAWVANVEGEFMTALEGFFCSGNASGSSAPKENDILRFRHIGP